MLQKDQNIRAKNKMGNNTEKPATIAEKKKSQNKAQKKQNASHIQTKKDEKSATKDSINAQDLEKKEKVPEDQDKTEIPQNQSVPSKDKEDTKKKIITKPKEKRNEASVNGKSLPISTKKSADICRFIMKKKITKAIENLEEILVKKKALPMKGEIPHKKGIMAGGYPEKTIKHFIKLLKSLQANASVNEIEDPIITMAVANMASKPYGKFGRWRRKRTHVKIIATEKNIIKLNQKKS